MGKKPGDFVIMVLEFVVCQCPLIKLLNMFCSEDNNSNCNRERATSKQGSKLVSDNYNNRERASGKQGNKFFDSMCLIMYLS